MEFIKSKASNLLPVLIVFLLSIPAILPFLHLGFFPVHDNTQVQRVYEMRTALLDGMFPVRWVKDLGYGLGYPIFNFYAPLPYYIGGILNLIGFDPLAATKLMFVFPVILSAISMYFLAKEFLGKAGAVTSSIFYIYAPYHALNIFVRGDVGELYAYSFFPIVFYSLYKIYKEDDWKYVALGGASFAMVVLSHNLSAFMLTPFMVALSALFVYSRLRDKKGMRIIKLALVFALGFLLSAFYFVPALGELKYTNIGSVIGVGSNFRDHFVCVGQLWSSSWGFGGSNPGCLDGISFKLGKLHIIFALAAIGLGTLSYLKRRNKDWLLVFLFLGLIFSVFMLLPISKPLWENVKPMEFLQFPWRYLSFVSFFISLLAGSAFMYLSFFIKDKRVIYLLCAAVLIMLIFNSGKIFQPQRFDLFGPGYYTSPSMLKWTTSKISDEYMPKNFQRPDSDALIPNSLLGGLNGSVLQDRTNFKEISLSMSKSTKATINLAYFPAWKVYMDQKPVDDLSDKGRISFNLPSGVHTVDLRFRQTMLEKISNILSLIGVGALVAVIMLSTRRRKNEKKA